MLQCEHREAKLQTDKSQKKLFIQLRQQIEVTQTFTFASVPSTSKSLAFCTLKAQESKQQRMAESVGKCLGHKEREDRRNIIRNMFRSLLVSLDGLRKVLIKRGPEGSVETSLKELEENYARKPEWKVIEKGGMLRIPV